MQQDGASRRSSGDTGRGHTFSRVQSTYDDRNLPPRESLPQERFEAEQQPPRPAPSPAPRPADEPSWAFTGADTDPRRVRRNRGRRALVFFTLLLLAIGVAGAWLSGLISLPDSSPTAGRIDLTPAPATVLDQPGAGAIPAASEAAAANATLDRQREALEGRVAELQQQAAGLENQIAARQAELQRIESEIEAARASAASAPALPVAEPGEAAADGSDPAADLAPPVPFPTRRPELPPE
jgi:hypothetical protein